MDGMTCIRRKEDRLKGGLGEVRRGKGWILWGDGRTGLFRRGAGLLSCDGDDGNVVLGDALAGHDSEVGSKGFEGIGRVEDARLPVNLDLGDRLEQGDHGILGLLVTLGGGGFEGGIHLCVAKIVGLAALEVSHARERGRKPFLVPANDREIETRVISTEPCFDR
jgi:hypothetical protein